MLGRSAVHFLIAFIFKNTNSYIMRKNVGGTSIYEIVLKTIHRINHTQGRILKNVGV